VLSVPLPFIVGLAVALTLYRSLKGIEAPGSRAYFTAFLLLYALQGMIVGLRFGYGIHVLEPVQPVTASIMPPLAFLAFRALAEPPPQRPWLHVIGPLAMVLALAVNTNWVDLLLLVLFSFYGISLLRLTLVADGAMVAAPFHRAAPVLRAARLTAGLMLFFAVSDAGLALYTVRYGNSDVPAAVGLINLAVVAGLTLSGAAALSHDLWGHVVKRGKADEREQLAVARVATVLLAVLAIGLGIVFKGQNVAFMVGLAFAIAASANFPALLLSMIWRRFTTMGAVASMATGTLSAIALIALSPTIQVDILGHASAPFPLKNPAIVTMTLAFVVGIVVSLVRPEPDAEKKFASVARRMHLGPE